MGKILNAVLLVLSVSVIGCYEAYDSRINMDDEVRSDSIESNILTRPVGAAFSALIGEGIDIKDVKTVRNRAGFMEVHVSGFNRAVGVRRFEYRIEWIDGNGLVIDTHTSTWLPVSAKGKSIFSFKAVAPRREAVDFRMNTRKQR